MSEETLLQRMAGRATALVLPNLLRFLDQRICWYDPSVDPNSPHYAQHGILVFWHEYILEMLPQWGHTPLSVLCSQHRDGEWVGQTAAALGMHVIRGSSSRGGSSAVRQIRKNTRFSSIAITPDGPRGPRREMAMGPIFMASALQLPIVPIGVGVSNPIRLGTWDRFAIPRYNSRVRIIIGPQIHLPKRLSREARESARLGIQQTLDDLTTSAEHWAEHNYRMQGEQPLRRGARVSRVEFDPAEPPARDRTNPESNPPTATQALARPRAGLGRVARLA